MPRQPVLALGLVAALALALAPQRGASRRHAAEPAHAAAAGRPRPEGATPSPVTRAPKRNPNILEPQPSLAIWTVVVFLVLLLVLCKFAWGPLSKALHQREEHMEHVLLDAERARNESERLLGRAPQAAGGHGRRGARPDRRGPPRRPGDRRRDHPQGAGRGRGVPGSRRARDRPRPRPGAGGDLDQDRRPGRLGRRPGPVPGVERVRPPPPGRRRRWANCRRARRPTGRGVATHEHRPGRLGRLPRRPPRTTRPR